MTVRRIAPILITIGIAWPQTVVDLKTQVKNADFSGFSQTKPAQVGTALPLPCSTGQFFFKSDATNGANIYGCVQGVWILQSGPTKSIFGRTGDVQPANGDYDFGLISGVASIAQGGTGATTPASALSHLGAASLLHTHTVDQVTNAISSEGSYSNPNWLTGLSWTKLTGIPASFTASPHATSHRHGGTDEVGTTTPTANGIPKADAAGKLSAAWLNLSGYQPVLGYTPLNPANSLIELPDTDAARANLGLGTAATKATQGTGLAVPTAEGVFAPQAIPVLDPTGTQVDSGCTASAGILTCNAGTPTRIGVTKGPKPPDSVVDGHSYDAVLFLDAADAAWKARNQDGSISSLSLTKVGTNDIGSAAYCPDTSATANSIVCVTEVPFPSAYAAGQAVWIKMAQGNTGPATININSAGVVPVTKNGALPLSAGDLRTGGMYLFLYDGSRFQAQLGSSSGSSGSSGSTGVDCSDPANICVADPFLPAGVTDQNIGALRWRLFGTSAVVTSVAGEEAHPGIYQLTTSATPHTSGVLGTAGIELQQSNVRPFASIATLANTTFLWKFKTPADLTETLFMVGLDSVATNGGGFPGQNGAWIKFANNTGCAVTGADSTFILQAKDGSGTSNGTWAAPAPAPSTWYWLKLYFTTAGTVRVQMKVDGGSWGAEGTVSGNIYSGVGAIPVIKHATCSSIAKSLQVDDFRYYKTGVN